MRRNSKLRVVDNEREHPRELAKRLLKQRRRLLPIVNQYDRGYTPLHCDEILARTTQTQQEHLGKK